MIWVLILRIAWPGSGTYREIIEFKTKAECFEALEKAEFLPIKDTRENEWGGYKACLPMTKSEFEDRKKMR
jgi:hypothetical protein